MRIPADVNTMRDDSQCPVCGSQYDGLLCDSCGFESPPEDMQDPDTEKKGREPQYQPQNAGEGQEDQGQEEEQVAQDQGADAATDLGEVENDPTTRINELQQQILQLRDLQRQQQMEELQQRQGARMSRFDGELRPRKRQAMVPGVQYDQVSNMYLDGPMGLSSMSPAPQPSQWRDVMPARNLNVQDLDAMDVMGGPGDNRVVAEPDIYATDQPMGERAASKHIKAAAKGLAEKQDTETVDNAFWKAHEALKTASVKNPRLKVVDRRLGLIFKQLKQGSSVRISEVVDRLKDVHDSLVDPVVDQKPGYKTDRNMIQATNGNQETSRPTQVQDLDDITQSRQEVMTPDFVTEVTVPNAQPNQLQLADVPPYYNDGASTGFVPQQSENKNPWPSDATNPAFAPYMQASKKESSREDLLRAVNLVDRLESLGMTKKADRAKHIAEYEKMPPQKIAGVELTLDNMEDSGAMKPRQAQRVAPAAPQGRMPEMGRATRTASVNRQNVLTDDYLMSL